MCGAIIISAGWDKCLVVKGFKSGATWSFPRGKINHGENERDCAVREVSWQLERTISLNLAMARSITWLAFWTLAPTVADPECYNATAGLGRDGIRCVSPL